MIFVLKSAHEIHQKIASLQYNKSHLIFFPIKGFLNIYKNIHRSRFLLQVSHPALPDFYGSRSEQSSLSEIVFPLSGECLRPQINQGNGRWTRYPSLCVQATEVNRKTRERLGE